MDKCALFEAEHKLPSIEAELAEYCTSLRFTLETIDPVSGNQPGGKHMFHQLTAGHSSRQQGTAAGSQASS